MRGACLAHERCIWGTCGAHVWGLRGACGPQDTWLMAPEKENLGAHMAMSALSRALHNTKKACIIRFVPRANQAVFVGCATPLLGDKDKPDCLVLNYLPFTGLILN